MGRMVMIPLRQSTHRTRTVFSFRRAAAEKGPEPNAVKLQHHAILDAGCS